MADCERLAKCPFFSDRMASMPKAADLMKQTFCRGDKTQCARYQVASAGLPVPMDLYPQEITRAHDLTRGH